MVNFKLLDSLIFITLDFSAMTVWHVKKIVKIIFRIQFCVYFHFNKIKGVTEIKELKEWCYGQSSHKALSVLNKQMPTR